MKTIAVITTGGTIGCAADPDTGALRPMVSGDELIRHVPGLRSLAHLEVCRYAEVLGPALEINELCAIARLVDTVLARPGVAGVVVTAGTGILEEGSYLCDLLATSSKPIVWTGAQLAPEAPGSDAPRNLLASVNLALSGAINLGAVVCFDGEVHAAREVTKVHATRFAAFSSYEAGILGRVDGAGVTWLRARRPRIVFPGVRLAPDVDLIKLTAGMDDRFFRASIASGARGIIVEGFPGLGTICPGALPGVVAALDAGLPVILGTRSPSGGTAATYGTLIGAADLVRRGVILAGDLAPVKARLLLIALIAGGASRDDIRRAFDAPS